MGCISANSKIKNGISAVYVNVFIKSRAKLQTFIINLSTFSVFDP